MLAIRLQRIGKKKFSTYRIIINEKGRDTKGRYLELLGTYNPHAKDNQFLPKAERVKYWLGKGAEASGTIHNLLVKAGLVEGKKVKSVYLSNKRKTKIGEKSAAAKAMADKKVADAAVKAEADAKAAEEAKAAAEAEALAAKEAAKVAAEAPAPEAVPAAPTETPAAPTDLSSEASVKEETPAT